VNEELFNAIMNRIDNIIKEPDNVIIQTIKEMTAPDFTLFEKAFRFLAGKTIREYIKSRKCYFAALDLINTSEAISAIAQKYNFNDHSTFTNTIKSNYNFPPSSIRAEQIPLPDNRLFYSKLFKETTSSYSQLILTALDYNLDGFLDNMLDTLELAQNEYKFSSQEIDAIVNLANILGISFHTLLDACFDAVSQDLNTATEYEDPISSLSPKSAFLAELGVSEKDAEEICAHYNCQCYSRTPPLIEHYRNNKNK